MGFSVRDTAKNVAATCGRRTSRDWKQASNARVSAFTWKPLNYSLTSSGSHVFVGCNPFDPHVKLQICAEFLCKPLRCVGSRVVLDLPRSQTTSSALYLVSMMHESFHRMPRPINEHIHNRLSRFAGTVAARFTHRQTQLARVYMNDGGRTNIINYLGLEEKKRRLQRHPYISGGNPALHRLVEFLTSNPPYRLVFNAPRNHSFHRMPGNVFKLLLGNDKYKPCVFWRATKPPQ